MRPLLLTLLFAGCFVIFSCTSKRNNNEFPETYLKALDTTLMENSGILCWKNLIWTFNDSGGKNEIYGVNPKSGIIVITVVIENAINIDWEDIAQDKHYLYIAETGNNIGNRQDLQILKLKKKDISKKSFQHVKAERIQYSYADQQSFIHEYKKHWFDCEALIAFNDNLYLFTKDWLVGKTKVYSIPKKPGNYIVSAVDSFNVNGLITGADINKDGTLALVGYRDYKSFAWLFKINDKSMFGTPQFINLNMLENAQTEGVCFTRKGDLLISCERTEAYNEQIWLIRKKLLK